MNFFQNVETALARQRQVEQDNITVHVPNQGDTFVAVLRFGYDRHSRTLGNDSLQPLAHNRMIVNDDDLNHTS